MTKLEVGKWYKTGEIQVKLQGVDQFLAIRCEVQRMPDGSLVLRGEATTEEFSPE